jgi:hypothetical protein
MVHPSTEFHTPSPNGTSVMVVKPNPKHNLPATALLHILLNASCIFLNELFYHT